MKPTIHLRFSGTPRSSFSIVGGSAPGTINATACRLPSLFAPLPSSPSGFGMLGCRCTGTDKWLYRWLGRLLTFFFLPLLRAPLRGGRSLRAGNGKTGRVRGIQHSTGLKVARVKGCVWVASKGAKLQTDRLLRIHVMRADFGESRSEPQKKPTLVRTERNSKRVHPGKRQDNWVRRALSYMILL